MLKSAYLKVGVQGTYIFKRPLCFFSSRNFFEKKIYLFFFSVDWSISPLCLLAILDAQRRDPKVISDSLGFLGKNREEFSQENELILGETSVCVMELQELRANRSFSKSKALLCFALHYLTFLHSRASEISKEERYKESYGYEDILMVRKTFDIIKDLVQ